MKKLASSLLVLAVLGFAVLAASAQALSSADRESAVKYLEATRKGVLDATAGLTEAQWNFKPAPDRWSVAEVAEHIAAAEDFLFGLVTNQVMKAPAATTERNVKEIDAMVLAQIPDRTNKVQAPEPLRPTNRFGSSEGSLKHFQESRDRTIQFLQKTPDLRAHAIDSPLGKQLDAYEWVLFIAAHSERHTKQIREVMADLNFPKK